MRLQGRSSIQDSFQRCSHRWLLWDCRPIKGGQEKRCCLLRAPALPVDKRCVDILHVPIPVPVPVHQAASNPNNALRIVGKEYARGRVGPQGPQPSPQRYPPTTLHCSSFG